MISFALSWNDYQQPIGMKQEMHE